MKKFVDVNVEVNFDSAKRINLHTKLHNSRYLRYNFQEAANNPLRAATLGETPSHVPVIHRSITVYLIVRIGNFQQSPEKECEGPPKRVSISGLPLLEVYYASYREPFYSPPRLADVSRVVKPKPSTRQGPEGSSKSKRCSETINKAARKPTAQRSKTRVRFAHAKGSHLMSAASPTLNPARDGRGCTRSIARALNRDIGTEAATHLLMNGRRSRSWL